MESVILVILIVMILQFLQTLCMHTQKHIAGFLALTQAIFEVYKLGYGFGYGYSCDLLDKNSRCRPEHR